MKTVVALAPLILLQSALLIAALVDIIKRARVTGDNKVPWLILILFVGTIGPIIYFILGRKET